MELVVTLNGNASEIRYGGQKLRKTGEREWRLALLRDLGRKPEFLPAVRAVAR